MPKEKGESGLVGKLVQGLSAIVALAVEDVSPHMRPVLLVGAHSVSRACAAAIKRRTLSMTKHGLDKGHSQVVLGVLKGGPQSAGVVLAVQGPATGDVVITAG